MPKKRLSIVHVLMWPWSHLATYKLNNNCVHHSSVHELNSRIFELQSRILTQNHIERWSARVTSHSYESISILKVVRNFHFYFPSKIPSYSHYIFLERKIFHLIYKLISKHLLMALLACDEWYNWFENWNRIERTYNYRNKFKDFVGRTGYLGPSFQNMYLCTVPVGSQFSRNLNY